GEDALNKAALDHFEKAMQANRKAPDAAEAAHWRALTYWWPWFTSRRGDFARIRQGYEDANALAKEQKSENWEAWADEWLEFAHGELTRNSASREAAIKAVRSLAAERYPKSDGPLAPAAARLLGDCYRFEGNLKEARQTYELGLPKGRPDESHTRLL